MGEGGAECWEEDFRARFDGEQGPLCLGWGTLKQSPRAVVASVPRMGVPVGVLEATILGWTAFGSWSFQLPGTQGWGFPAGLLEGDRIVAPLLISGC